MAWAALSLEYPDTRSELRWNQLSRRRCNGNHGVNQPATLWKFVEPVPVDRSNFGVITASRFSLLQGLSGMHAFGRYALHFGYHEKQSLSMVACHSFTRDAPNAELGDAGWRAFNLLPLTLLINEKSTEADGQGAGKSLGLWRIADLRVGALV